MVYTNHSASFGSVRPPSPDDLSLPVSGLLREAARREVEFGG